MTRMLCSVISLILCGFLLGNCSLFSAGDEVKKLEEFDSNSIVGDESLEDGAFDAEDEIASEAKDLGGTDEFAESSFDEPQADLAVDDEFADSDFGDPQSDLALDDEFGSTELEPFADSNEVISQTNPQQIDQSLAKDEFADFSDEEFNDDKLSDNNEFALQETPVIDEPTSLSPVVDIPQDFVTSTNEVTNLEYKAFENGGTVVIETAVPASYQTIENVELNQLIIQINDVKLPQRFKRPYITKDFKQDIATINAYEDQTTNSAKFVIQMKRPLKPTVQKEGSSILIMTGTGSSLLADSSQEALSPFASKTQVDVNYNEYADSASAGSSASSPELAFGDIDKSGLDLNSGKFTGDPINLEFTDTDIRTIIEVIANKSGVNLIMDEDVSGKSSILLREVPWDQALLVTLHSKGLGYVKQGNVLRIAKQETLSKEAQAISTQIKNEKEAKLLSSGLKVKYIPVSYARVSELSGKLKEFTSKEGKIAFDDRTSSLVITDYGEYIDRMEELVKALDTPPMQVEIEAKLVEAREEFTREAGINWGSNGGSFSSGGRTGSVNVNTSGNLPTTSALTMDLSVGVFDIFGDLTAALGLYEKQDKIKVLSQPRTITMNKTEAIIEQVTQIPVVTAVPVAAGQATIPNVIYKDLKLSLQVTPQITFKGDVILDVDLNREFAGTKAINGQIEINKRHSKTTVMVKNGKTAVIGGIYQMDDQNVDSGVPWLKDIPLLGYLFKKTSQVQSKNELLLFLKPKIIKEIDESTTLMAKPSSNFDPFEELSIDEGSNSKTPFVDSPSEENFDDDSFDDADFNDGVSL